MHQVPGSPQDYSPPLIDFPSLFLSKNWGAYTPKILARLSAFVPSPLPVVEKCSRSLGDIPSNGRVIIASVLSCVRVCYSIQKFSFVFARYDKLYHAAVYGYLRVHCLYVRSLFVCSLFVRTNVELWEVPGYTCKVSRSCRFVLSCGAKLSDHLSLLEPQSHMWGQTTQISSSLSPKRDCGSKGVNTRVDDCCAFNEWTNKTLLGLIVRMDITE